MQCYPLQVPWGGVIQGALTEALRILAIQTVRLDEYFHQALTNSKYLSVQF
jgi:hypothetical protein